MECVEIWEPLKGDINGVRQTFKNRMKKRYDGWKDNYDEQWDKNSFLFVLKKDNEYIATCRMIVKRYYDFNFKIPMEEASVKSFSLDKYHNICLEGGMVSFKDFLSFGKLMYYVGSWLYENEVDYLFTCYDVENELIKNLYVDMLNFEIVENAQLVYGNFTSKKTKKEVVWQVVKSDKEHGKKTMDKLLADLGIVYEQGIYPSLKEWIAKYEK